MTPLQIAADIVAYLAARPQGNDKGRTAEGIVAQWERNIACKSLKVGGKAWNRELLGAARAGWVTTTQKSGVFIPPSEETLAWGGFLGGEWVYPADMAAKAEAAFDARF